MKHTHVLLSLAASLAVLPAIAQSQVTGGVPVSMVVTVAGRRGSDVPNLTGDNVVVYQNRARAKVTDFVALQGEHANLELLLVLDDSRQTSYGRQLDDIRSFILAQPETTKVGVAYLQEGGPKMVQGLTADHALAAQALHLTQGNLANGADPFDSVEKLIEQWPTGNGRREILLISSGIDNLFTQDLDNPGAGGGGSGFDPSVDAAIERAQRGGIIVFAIGTGPALIGGNERRPGRNNLARLAEETGGKLYFYQSSSPTSFVPYLDDSSLRLNRQYLVTFLAQPGKKPGLQSVKVRTDAPHAELVAAPRVYVPSPRQ